MMKLHLSSGGDMTAVGETKKHFAKVFGLPALWLLVIPLAAIAFTAYGISTIDNSILQAIWKNVEEATDLDADEKPNIKDFYQQHTASVVCDDDDPRVAKYRESVCSRGGDVWQFIWARRLALFATGLAVVALLGALIVGWLAFKSRRAQYVSFVVGWRALTFISVLEIVLQGALMVWLSYWVTALLFERYVPKLILVVGLLAVMAVFAAVKGIFSSPPPPNPLDAERIEPRDAPALWSRLNELASRMGTAPPAQVLAGIDDNFFVTEAPVHLVSEETKGRTLFVSLPLLRVLESSEADAVLAHELAHFKGGDAEASAKLWPQLVRFDEYMSQLGTQLLSLPAFLLLQMFRVIFEFALKKEQREREFEADRQAAAVTAATSLGRALLKVVGYSLYREEVERGLFESHQEHREVLSIGHRVQQGYSQFATSNVQRISFQRAPHPFDSHPPLEDRLKNVGSAELLADAVSIFQSEPGQNWTEHIATAKEIESRLWTEYESRFTRAHELSLAYRYTGETPVELELIQRHFPPQEFALKKGGAVTLNFQTLEWANGEPPLLLADVTAATMHEENFSSELWLTIAGKLRKLNLKLLVNSELFKQKFGAYWGRAASARDFVSQQSNVTT